MIRLADAAEVAGDGLRPPQMNIGAVSALCVQCLYMAGADNLHGCREGGKVTIVFLFFHLAHTNETGGHQFAPCNGAFGGCDKPGEILGCTDFQRDGVFVLKCREICFVTQHLMPEIGHADESASVSLLDEPVSVGQVLRIDRCHLFTQGRQLARSRSLAVDLLWRAVLRHYL